MCCEVKFEDGSVCDSIPAADLIVGIITLITIHMYIQL